MRLIAEFRLSDSLGRTRLLLVRRGDGEIRYALTGKNNGVPHALSALGCRGDLPFADTGQPNNELLEEIARVVKTGRHKIEALIPSMPEGTVTK